MLAEAGVRALSYRTVKRRLPGYATAGMAATGCPGRARPPPSSARRR